MKNLLINFVTLFAFSNIYCEHNNKIKNLHNLAINFRMSKFENLIVTTK